MICVDINHVLLQELSPEPTPAPTPAVNIVRLCTLQATSAYMVLMVALCLSTPTHDMWLSQLLWYWPGLQSDVCNDQETHIYIYRHKFCTWMSHRMTYMCICIHQGSYVYVQTMQTSTPSPTMAPAPTPAPSPFTCKDQDCSFCGGFCDAGFGCICPNTYCGSCNWYNSVSQFCQCQGGTACGKRNYNTGLCENFVRPFSPTVKAPLVLVSWFFALISYCRRAAITFQTLWQLENNLYYTL